MSTACRKPSVVGDSEMRRTRADRTIAASAIYQQRDASDPAAWASASNIGRIGITIINLIIS